MIVITGGAGFIGSNLVKSINQESAQQVLVVDNLSNTAKVANLADCTIADYRDKNEFYQSIIKLDRIPGLEAILHQGACSDTMVTDGRYVMQNNYQYSKALLEYCEFFKVPFLYASSASVYGGNQTFVEDSRYELPLNAYAYSKLAFDQHIRSKKDQISIPVVGLRYFNVYGPREQHKGRMASVAYHFFNQFKKDGKVRLFEGCDGYENGAQLRDFISVEDVVKVNWYFLNNQQHSGIYNLGTGNCQSFNEVAQSVVNYFLSKQGVPEQPLESMQKQGLIEYIEFPQSLVGKYQSFTQADMSKLKQSGYENEFLTVGQGVSKYMSWLDQINKIQ